MDNTKSQKLDHRNKTQRKAHKSAPARESGNFQRGAPRALLSQRSLDSREDASALVLAVDEIGMAPGVEVVLVEDGREPLHCGQLMLVVCGSSLW